MKHQIFTVLDGAAEVFNLPFYFRSKGEALRWFHDICADPENPVAKHPKDYTLYYIGEYDDNSGEFQESIKIAMLTAIEAIAANESFPDGEQISNGPPVLASPAS